jgi:class 3 adenylate cyclase
VKTPVASDRRPGLPTGVVTFLFSDIEGSTRLLQALDECGVRRGLGGVRRSICMARCAMG